LITLLLKKQDYEPLHQSLHYQQKQADNRYFFRNGYILLKMGRQNSKGLRTTSLSADTEIDIGQYSRISTETPIIAILFYNYALYSQFLN